MAAMGFSDIIEVHRPGEDSDAGVSIIVNGINFEMDSSSVTFNGKYLLVSLGKLAYSIVLYVNTRNINYIYLFLKKKQ